MQRSALRAFSITAAVLLACVLAPTPASAGDAPAFDVENGLLGHEKVGRSGQVYRWKPDC